MILELECRKWWDSHNLTKEDEERLYWIYHCLARRIIQSKIGKKPRNEGNWPKARIYNYVGTLCMRDENILLEPMLEYVERQHKGDLPSADLAIYPSTFGKVIVIDYLRYRSESFFTSSGRRELHSLTKEVGGLSSIDVFGAIAVAIHELADELSTRCGGSDVQE